MLNQIKELLKAFLLGLLIFLISIIFIRIGNIPSDSMYPTFYVGDRVIGITTMIKEPDRGDIVVFEPNENEKEEEHELWVKRLIGKPGDKVEIDNGIVIVNGDKIDEPYIENNMDYTGTFVVPEGRYLLLGDNRANSADSRFWANPFIHLNQAKYVVKMKIYPKFVFYK